MSDNIKPSLTKEQQAILDKVNAWKATAATYPVEFKPGPNFLDRMTSATWGPGDAPASEEKR